MQPRTLILLAGVGSIGAFVLFASQSAVAQEIDTTFYTNSCGTCSCFPTCDSLVTGEPYCMAQQAQITYNPSTWPTGDRIWDCCRAIAIAEGANIAGSNPDKLNNPGDISDGYTKFNGEFHSGSLITNFPDKTTGWQWLYTKVSNHVNGRSLVYPPTLTIAQFAQKYAANWQNWMANVGEQLNVDPITTSFLSYVNGGE